MYVSEKQKIAFWKKVDKRGPDDCWPWIGALHKDGYGIFTLMRERDGKRIGVLTHRVAAFLAGMQIDGIQVCHDCDNPPCCNERHFFLGTQLDNMRDCARKGRCACLGGEKNGNAKLTEIEYFEVRALLDAGYPGQAIAKAYGIGYTQAYRIRDGESWSKHYTRPILTPSVK